MNELATDEQHAALYELLAEAAAELPVEPASEEREAA